MQVPHKPVVGWDIGGAHIKAAFVERENRVETVLQWPCPLWLGLDRLEQGLEHVIGHLGVAALNLNHAVTMTGELVDLFPDRATGVRRLIDVMRDRFTQQRTLIYAGASGFLSPESAATAMSEVASANWYASASFAARQMSNGLLIDVGSTTTDLIPFSNGDILASGYNDHQRLSQEELIYSGVVRTPLMAVTRQVPFRGRWVPLMAEQFATTADIYRLTTELPEDADLLPSADNGEKSVAGSARRLARMVGLDVHDAGSDEWQRMASYISEQQLRTLADACERAFSRIELPVSAPLVGAGVGRYLVRKLSKRLGRSYVGFDQLVACDEQLRDKVAECAPAVAVANLALEAIA